MIGETTKLLAGPILALAPLLTWELVVKPARTRRNVALVLIAEIKQSLSEIAYYRLRRDEDKENHMVNLVLPRGGFIALQSVVAELAPVTLDLLIQFYGSIAKL